MAGCSAESQAAFGALGTATGLRNPSARIEWSNIVREAQESYLLEVYELFI